MNSIARITLAIATSALAACAGGEDVVIETGKSGSASTACVVSPGEDVCGNVAKYAGPETSAEALSSAQALVDFADLARGGIVSLHAACSGILDDLGADKPLDDEAGTPAARAIARCDAATAALGRARLEDVRIEAIAPVCTTAPRRSCDGAVGTEGTSCGPATVRVTLAPNAKPESTKLKDALEHNLGAVFGFKGRLEGLASVVATIKWSALAGVRAACAPELSALGAAAVAEAQAGASIAGDLVSIVSR